MHMKAPNAASSTGATSMTAQNMNIAQTDELVTMQWSKQRFASDATPFVFPPKPNDPMDDAAEIAFAEALSIRPQLQQQLTNCSTSANTELHAQQQTAKPDALQQDLMHHVKNPIIATNVCARQTRRRRKACAMSDGIEPLAQPAHKRRHPAGIDAEYSPAAQQRLLFAPVAAAAAEVGLPKSVLQRWIADEQVAFIRPQPNNSHRLVDMADLRQLLQQKRQVQTGVRGVDKAASSKRVLIYARVTPTEAAQPLTDVQHVAPANSGLNEHIVEQVKQIAHAMELEPGKYMYNGDIATVWDWDNRPVFDLLVDKILSRDIHTIVVATPDHLVRGTAFTLLQRLCQRNGIEIKCAITDAPAAAAAAAKSDATHEKTHTS